MRLLWLRCGGFQLGPASEKRYHWITMGMVYGVMLRSEIECVQQTKVYKTNILYAVSWFQD